MATTPITHTSLSSVVNTLSMSKARLKRRHTTRKDITTDETTTTTSEGIPNIERDAKTEKENESPPETLPEQQQTNQREHGVTSIRTEQDGSLLEVKETPVRRVDAENMSNTADSPPVACININIKYAAPIKAKLLLSSLAMRITFVNRETGLPVKKSSPTINAVSYYENSNVDFVMPVMTKPAEIESDKKGQLLAKWSEDIVFCELKDHLLESEDVIILLELLILPTTHQSPYPVAWGILFPSRITCSDNTIPIQLYRIPPRKRATIKSSELVGIHSPSKYPTLAYITITVNERSSLSNEPNLRSVIPTLPEVSNNSEYYSLTTTRGKIEETDNNCVQQQWTRLPGQPCAITDEYCGSLLTSNNGCSTATFSPSGRLLASACINNTNQAIINIHKLVPSVGWGLVTTLVCSIGIVYECIWSHDETRIACASSSGLCHVWTLDNCNEQLLPHPSYVYTIQWILHSSVLVSGCYDGAIRCWNNEGKLIEVILSEGHRINTLCLDNNRLYSGAVDGCITVWIINDSMEGGNLLQKERVLHIPSLNGCSVQTLIVIPGQQRLIVHAIKNPYLIIDLRLDSITVTMTPDRPIIHPNAICATPCGNLLLTNNANKRMCVWDIDKGIIIENYKIRGLKGPLSSMTYHPFEHLAVCTAIGHNQRIIMMTKKS